MRYHILCGRALVLSARSLSSFIVTLPVSQRHPVHISTVMPSGPCAAMLRSLYPVSLYDVRRLLITAPDFRKLLRQQKMQISLMGLVKQ